MDIILKLCKVHIILSTCIIKTRLSSYYCLQFWKTTGEQGETFVLRGQMAQANSTFHLTAELSKLDKAKNHDAKNVYLYLRNKLQF